MPDTSASLLSMLRRDSSEQAWTRLVDVYTPLIRGWLIRHGATPQDTDDLVQEVLSVVVRRMADFERAPRTGAFRSWLRRIAVNCLRDHWRKRKKQPAPQGGTDFARMLHELQDPKSGVSKMWDEEHDRHITGYLLKMIRPQFRESTWLAFQRVAMEGATAEEAAAELDMTVNAVFIAKSRVLTALRHAGEGLIE